MFLILYVFKKTNTGENMYWTFNTYQPAQRVVVFKKVKNSFTLTQYKTQQVIKINDLSTRLAWHHNSDCSLNIQCHKNPKIHNKWKQGTSQRFHCTSYIYDDIKIFSCDLLAYHKECYRDSLSKYSTSLFLLLFLFLICIFLNYTIYLHFVRRKSKLMC
jgi:hypothetical protein